MHNISPEAFKDDDYDTNWIDSEAKVLHMHQLVYQAYTCELRADKRIFCLQPELSHPELWVLIHGHFDGYTNKYIYIFKQQ